MTEFQAAILLGQMQRYEDQLRRRETNALYLNRELSAVPGIVTMQRGRDETRHAYHLYIFRFDPVSFGGLSRERFIDALSAEGIPCSEGYPHPLYRQPLFLERRFAPFYAQNCDVDYASTCLLVSEQAGKEAVWIPHQVLLGDEGVWWISLGP